MPVLSTLLGAMLILAAQSALPSAPPPDEVEGVVVEADRRTVEERREAVSKFVRGLSATTGRKRLARWESAICPGVVGLPAEQAGYIADRIAMEAQAVGLDVRGPGCTPDILILVTNEADKAAADFRRKHAPYFAHKGWNEYLTYGGDGQALPDFLRTSKPVRWWHVAKLKGSDGRLLDMYELPDTVLPRSGKRVPLLETTGASRLASSVREDFVRALIIVDTTRLRGISYEALSSYLAMVSLAQIEAAPEPGALASILDLFAARDAGRPLPETLTASDRAYLKGLYAAPADARNLNAQRGAIRRSVEAATGR